ncbi:MAG TPA: hypothetical protein VF517_16915 [Thermoleophilaceae bacterium]
MEQPDWWVQPVYDQGFGTFAWDEACEGVLIDPGQFNHCPAFVSAATGGGDLFVSTSYPDARVEVYDGATLAHKLTISDAALGEPRGITYYRGEVFVMDGSGADILVFDAASGSLRRRFTVPAGFGEYVWQLMPTGVDAAWGELWITYMGGLGGGAVVVLDSQTGAEKGASWHVQRLDSTAGELWWDIATVPEMNGVLAQCRFASRVEAVQPVPLDEVQADEATGGNACSSKGEQGGIDAVWGMRWFLSVQEPRDGGPLAVNEFAIEPGGATAARLSPLRRSWRPRMNEPNGGEFVHHDVAYQPRDARVTWTGALTKSDWMHGTRCADYVVSDADIYVVGTHAERWYEPARGFQQIDLLVDGAVRGTQTTPTGQFCFDTNSVPSGTHNVQLRAKVNNGAKTVHVTNPSANWDHSPPDGGLDSLPRFVSGDVTVSGPMTDPHSGPMDWQAQVQRVGGSWQDLCAPVPTAGAADGKYSCPWSTTSFSDGDYNVRAQKRDLVSGAWGGANVGWTPEAVVGVDNSPPSSIGLSGELRDAEDYRPNADGDRPFLDVAVSDAGSGGTGADLLVDGVSVASASGACPGGGCTFTHRFEFVPENFSDGEHTISVTGRDALGHTRTSESWIIDVERVAGEAPDHGDPGTESDDPAGGAAASRSDSAAADEVAAALGLLPCTSEDEPANFPTYSLGSSFDGMPITAINRICEVPSPHELPRPNFVEFIYGTCTPDPVLGACQPPVVVQSWPACERNLSSYAQSGIEDFQLDYVLTTLRGVPGALFDTALRAEVYTEDATLVVFGETADQTSRAVSALRQEPAGAAPGALAPINRLDIGGKLPPPVPGALKGRLPCQ